MLSEFRSRIAARIAAAIAPLAQAAGVAVPAIALERPKQAAHGDAACTVALQLAKPLGKPPRAIAQAIADFLAADDESKALLASVEIAGPGFLNLTVTDAVHQAVVERALREGEGFGRNARGAGTPVVVEFVSANPTGPLHVGHGRQGALGDSLAALLAANGWAVSREFYYNDAGNQIDNLARSVQARVRGIDPDSAEFPADGYRGEYIHDIAKAYLAKATVEARDVAPVHADGDPENLDEIRRFAVAYLRHEQDLDLQAFGVAFDRYYLESSLYTEGRVERAVAELTTKGHAYEQDGALWLRSTTWGDDKDRVMRKSDGGYTYFVPDVAYHVTKWERGYRKAINVQGSDHHGTIARVRAGLQALDIGIPQQWPDYVLHKMVTVMKGGEEVKISKRAGSYVTLRDLIDWTSRDAVRFFLVSRKADTEFVFDVDLALAATDENPVFYVQYAHARICSIIANWNEQRAAAGEGAYADLDSAVATLAGIDLAPLVAPKERALMARLAEWPDVVAQACDELAPHAVAYWLRELAADFHGFYNAERVLVDDARLRDARLALLAATRQALRNGLALLGVSAPEKM